MEAAGGSFLEVTTASAADSGLADRFGMGLYPGQSLRLYAADKSNMRWGFANSDGSFRDAVVVTSDGNVGMGTEAPAARLHVQGDAAVDGQLRIGPYVLSASQQGLQVCRGPTCQFLLEVDEDGEEQ